MSKLLFKASKIIVENKNASVPFLFSELDLEYPKILELINELEKKGVLGPYV
tara:strand:- start:906 stop:1061 length:156 start_codon:yes stop_codon:yes gene_type:complete